MLAQHLRRQLPFSTSKSTRQLASFLGRPSTRKGSFERCYAGKISRRAEQTDDPVIVKTKQLIAGTQNVISLAQGVVHWSPPQAALDAASSLVQSAEVSSYGPCTGLPELVAALEAKLEAENHLPGHKVMVTAGANQAFVNLVLALLDPQDAVVLFAPYYFNHMMALQMTGGADKVVLGPCDPESLRPDLRWLEAKMKQPDRPKMVVLINPCNPTGILLSREELKLASDICKASGAWLVMDNTYEHFVYDGKEHVCLAGNHIIHIFSFSKAFGMMGWRTGYLAYQDQGNRLSDQLQKIQDTIPICPPQLSMHVALHAVAVGPSWVKERLSTLLGNREVLLNSLSVLGSPGQGIAKSEGAIYLWARLPKDCSDDEAVVAWLVREYQICLIPGSSCGAPGYIRVAFGNLHPEVCKQAAARLKEGLQRLVAEGIAPQAQLVNA